MSKRPNEAEEDFELPPKRRDMIEINVGGRHFAAAISTLRANSSYFDSLFSGDWYREKGPIFVDQDPEAFAVLQSFMRLGSIDSSELTKAVLLQAEFLGMDRLLAAVKCLAYCNMNLNFSGSDEEAVAAFDYEHQGIAAAFASGILPTYLTEEKGARKEYARLSIWGPHVAGIINDRMDLYVTVQVPRSAIDPLAEGGNLPSVTLTDCHLFLDALNWLHRHGFTTREEEYETEIPDICDFDVFLFSRKLKRSTPSESLSQVITVKKEAVHEEDRKEFAVMVSWKGESNWEAYVEADVGTTCTISYRCLDEQHEASSRIFKKVDGSELDKINWLHNKGYNTREESLEARYQLVKKQEHALVDLKDRDIKVRLSSRPLQRRTAENGEEDAAA